MRVLCGGPTWPGCPEGGWLDPRTGIAWSSAARVLGDAAPNGSEGGSAVYLDWRFDRRPTWRFCCVFKVIRVEDDGAGKVETRRLERVVAATGHARSPRATLRCGQISLVLLLRAVDEPDAVYRGLSVLDAAQRQVAGLQFDELLWRSAMPVPRADIDEAGF